MQGCAKTAASFSESDLLAASDELQRIVVDDALRLTDPGGYKKAIADQLHYLSTIVGDLNAATP